MQNILITGANRGIGLAFTSEYLKRGDRVLATCRHPHEADALHKLQQQYPDALAILNMDVTNSAQIAACRALATEHVHALNVLINNAGIMRQVEHITEIHPEDLVDSLRVNAVGPTLVANAFIDLLEAGKPSKLVNITMPTQTITKLDRTSNQIYVASRYATNALTKMMALEFAPRGITTVGLYPGMIQTDMNNYSKEAVPAADGIPKAVDTIEAITPKQNGLALLPDGKVYEW
jgi:NAD(P)-dependent dehydrogenase (short-subunit alcohol dehydrogenase family)